MPRLPPLERDQVPADLLPLWDECQHRFPVFRHLWGTIVQGVACDWHNEFLELDLEPGVAPHQPVSAAR